MYVYIAWKESEVHYRTACVHAHNIHKCNEKLNYGAVNLAI